MANKKISDFTEKSSLANSDLFLVSDGSNTYKVTTDTMRAKMNITVRTVTGTTDSQGAAISAPTVAGYTFLCWLHVYCTNGATFMTLPAPTQQSTRIYGPSGYPFQATALYVHQ